MLARVAAGGGDEARSSLRLALTFCLAVAAPLCLMAAVFADDLLIHVFGADFKDAAGVLRIYAAGGVALAVATVLGDTLRGLGRPLDPAKAEVGGALSTIVLLVLLVPAYGVEGAAAASTASYTLVVLMLALMVTRRLRRAAPRPAPRLVVVASHPIQCQAPLYRAQALDRRLDLHVLVLCRHGLSSRPGTGFGATCTRRVSRCFGRLRSAGIPVAVYGPPWPRWLPHAPALAATCAGKYLVLEEKARVSRRHHGAESDGLARGRRGQLPPVRGCGLWRRRAHGLAGAACVVLRHSAGGEVLPIVPRDR